MATPEQVAELVAAVTRLEQQQHSQATEAARALTAAEAERKALAAELAAVRAEALAGDAGGGIRTSVFMVAVLGSVKFL